MMRELNQKESTAHLSAIDSSWRNNPRMINPDVAAAFINGTKHAFKNCISKACLWPISSRFTHLVQAVHMKATESTRFLSSILFKLGIRVRLPSIDILEFEVFFEFEDYPAVFFSYNFWALTQDENPQHHQHDNGYHGANPRGMLRIRCASLSAARRRETSGKQIKNTDMNTILYSLYLTIYCTLEWLSKA